jgi:hypothetical protein
LETTHPALQNTLAGGWNFMDNTADVSGGGQPLPSVHATHIAGIIAANSNESVKIMLLAVFGEHGAYTSDIVAAILYAEEGMEYAEENYKSCHNCYSVVYYRVGF